MSWFKETNTDNFDSELEKLSADLPEPPPAPKPDIETKLVDLATEVEDKKQYLPQEGEKKPFEKRKEAGVRVSEPVNVYEPGFRTDLYEGIMRYFKEKRREKDRLEKLRAKIGLR